MSQVYIGNGSGGSGGSIQTINGDVGSITGSTVTIYADNAGNNSGATVEFVNSGTISTLNLSDAHGNTMVGSFSGNTITPGSLNSFFGSEIAQNINSGTNNTAMGNIALGDLTSGSFNCAIGTNALQDLQSGVNNSSFGTSCLQGIVSGSNNIGIGFEAGSSYVNAESSNILIGNSGVSSESNTIRIGTQGSADGEQDTCYMAGITGTTAAGSPVAVSSTGQLSDLGYGTATQVLTSNGAGNSPTWQTAGGGGAKSCLTAYNNSNISNVTGDNTIITVTYNSTLLDRNSDFNTATSTFTAPINGDYNFEFSVSFFGLNTTTSTGGFAQLLVNGTSPHRLVQIAGNSFDITDSDTLTMNGSIVLPLSATDTVIVQAVIYGNSKSVGLEGGSGGAFTTLSVFQIP